MDIIKRMAKGKRGSVPNFSWEAKSWLFAAFRAGPPSNISNLLLIPALSDMPVTDKGEGAETRQSGDFQDYFQKRKLKCSSHSDRHFQGFGDDCVEICPLLRKQ